MRHERTPLKSIAKRWQAARRYSGRAQWALRMANGATAARQGRRGVRLY